MTSYAMFDPTALYAGDKPARHRPITLASGSNASGSVTKRGTLLGRKVTGGTAVATAKTGGNTGNGTCAVDGSTPVLANARQGNYVVTFTSATAFTVTDPMGRVLGNGVNGTAFADQIKFTTTAGGTAFVAGDAFNIAVVPTDKYLPCVATATDGSQEPAAVLCGDTDASGGDVVTPAYFEGEFAGEVMTIDASWTIAQVQTALRQTNSSIFVRSVGALG